MIADPFIPIRVGQVWSVKDNYYSSHRRYVEVLSVQPGANDRTLYGPKIKVINTGTGRVSFPKAATVRSLFTLEDDVEEEQPWPTE